MGVVLPQPIPFGKYTLFERLGRGGMADVFKARVQGPGGFERIFVIKRILSHLSDDPTFTRMFIEEAKVAARLNHPNIVQVFELGSVEGEYFMSMEYVRGRDLAETMRTLWARVGPPRPELVAYIGREMCRALAYAHDFTSEDGTPLGMIHRDISPSNVMLSYDGTVKILDFGIAKALGGDKDESTRSGTLKGKFAYMAPEQTASNDIDRRIDIFATGIVLHEILTGRRLFKGENDLQTIERVRQCDVPPPSLHNPLCPRELDGIVLQALSKRKEDRFQSASEMADALDDVVHAARFQPGHLSQIMRALFPADTGGDPRAAIPPSHTTQNRTASVSPSRPTTVPSPTGGARPPVSTRHPLLATGSSQSSYAPVVPLLSLPSASQNKPFWARPATWVGGGVGLAAILLLVGGMSWMRGPNVTPDAGQGSAGAGLASTSLETTLSLAIQSSPSGADVLTAPGNVLIGRTPFRKEFSYRPNKPAFLLFRLKGYRELTHEIRPGWSGSVVLEAVPAEPDKPPEGVRPRPRKRVKDYDPWETERRP